MTAATVELRITDSGLILVDGRPATTDETQAFDRFIQAPRERHHEFHAALGSPPGGIVIKTPEARDLLN